MVKRSWMVKWMWTVFVFFLGEILCLSHCHAAETTRVTIKTSQGDIVVELDHEKAPITVDNFLSYVDSGFYNGTIFHRVISGFMIQGGGFDDNLNQKTTQDPIINEAGNGLSNLAYTIAMARTSDPDSATSQFYINLVDNPSLDKSDTRYGYTVFGHVVEGQSVVDAIGTVATTTVGYYSNVPVEAIVINSIARVVDDMPDDGDDSGKEDSDGHGGGGGCFIDVLW